MCTSGSPSSSMTGARPSASTGPTATADWLATSGVPKLFVKAEPGGILASRAMVDFVRKWPAQDEVKVAGVHFVQEDSPDEIGRAIAGWMGTLSCARAREAGSFR